MININDATAALQPKPEGFRLTEEWQQIKCNGTPNLFVKKMESVPGQIQLVAGAHRFKEECSFFNITALRELSAFCAALADYLERGQG